MWKDTDVSLGTLNGAKGVRSVPCPMYPLSAALDSVLCGLFSSCGIGLSVRGSKDAWEKRSREEKCVVHGPPFPYLKVLGLVGPGEPFQSQVFVIGEF
jgi:hypothetical protein